MTHFLMIQLLARLVKHDLQRFWERRLEKRFKRERIAWFIIILLLLFSEPFGMVYIDIFLPSFLYFNAV